MLRRDRPETRGELSASLLVLFAVPLAGVERLFFSRSPSFFTHRCTEDQLAATPWPVLIFSRNSSIVRSACASTSDNMRALTGSVIRLGTPYRDCG